MLFSLGCRPTPAVGFRIVTQYDVAGTSLRANLVDIRIGMEELNVSEIHFHQEIHDPTVYFKMKGSEEEGKRGRDVEDLKEKAELLQQLQVLF